MRPVGLNTTSCRAALFTTILTSVGILAACHCRVIIVSEHSDVQSRSGSCSRVNKSLIERLVLAVLSMKPRFSKLRII